MGLNLQDITNSRFGVGLALLVGRTMPRRMGYWLVEVLGGRIAAMHRSQMIRSVRANQWVIRGENPSSASLSQAVVDTFRQTGYGLYDLYHNIHSLETVTEMIEFSPEAWELIARHKSASEPIVYAGIHTSNIDLVMVGAVIYGLNVLGITIPQSDNESGYEWQTQMRRDLGLEMLPASVATLRTAVHRLEEGGSVMTGLDRPLPTSKYCPKFFGRPAAMPVMHIHLALKAAVPVVIVAGNRLPSGSYYIQVSNPICMETRQDRHSEILHNAERVLEIAAGFIRKAPEQWAMFYPVWPEALAEMP